MIHIRPTFACAVAAMLSLLLAAGCIESDRPRAAGTSAQVPAQPKQAKPAAASMSADTETPDTDTADTQTQDAEGHESNAAAAGEKAGTPQASEQQAQEATETDAETSDEPQHAAADPTTSPDAGEKPTDEQAAGTSEVQPDTNFAELLQTASQGGAIWNQWAGTPMRNNTPIVGSLPQEWTTGIDKRTQQWDRQKAKNIKWVARLGSQSYGNPVIADGKVFVGTNNGAGWLSRYPATVDLGCLLCFSEADGTFLWQHSSEKLPTGRVHDWPLQGICCAPLVEGDRLWFVSSRGHVICLDTEGFHDGTNDGPYQDEPVVASDEADVIWSFDMMAELQVSQHNMCSCSVTAAGDLLFVCTSNGVDESHVTIPSPNAPSFMAMDKNTGRVLWTDNTPGRNILHGQWSSPAYAVLGGVPQAIFGGGDGWLYSFRAEGTPDGKAELLWRFDCNPKEAKYSVDSRSTRNHIIGTPVIYDGLVYVAVGEDPEHGQGNGHLWCIDPTKRGDVSSELAFSLADPENPLPPRRIQNVIPEQNEVARPNPNSACVWHYVGFDANGDGTVEGFEEEMHRTCGTVCIKDDILVIPDFNGLIHCLNAKTGEGYWTHDLLAECWSSPLIADGKIYIGDAEGRVTVFALAKEKNLLAENDMGNAVYTTPVVANGVLYVANKTHLFAIQEPSTDTETTAAAEPADATEPVEHSEPATATEAAADAEPAVDTAPAAGSKT